MRSHGCQEPLLWQPSGISFWSASRPGCFRHPSEQAWRFQFSAETRAVRGPFSGGTSPQGWDFPSATKRPSWERRPLISGRPRDGSARSASGAADPQGRAGRPLTAQRPLTARRRERRPLAGPGGAPHVRAGGGRRRPRGRARTRAAGTGRRRGGAGRGGACAARDGGAGAEGGWACRGAARGPSFPSLPPWPCPPPPPPPPPPAAQKMASPCGRQQCSIERRGVRHQLDSWRHKLIHCVGEGRAARRGGRAGPRGGGGGGGGGGGEGRRGGSGGAAACGPSPARRAAVRRAAPGRAPPFGGRAPPGGPALLCGPCQRRARSSPPGPAAAPSNLFTGGPGRARRRGAAAVSARAWGEAGDGKLRVGAGSRGSGLCDCFPPPFCFLPLLWFFFSPSYFFFPSHQAQTLVSFLNTQTRP